ncbi:uncharacterized protein LOC119381901 [Rhipicephalus sanguineus]|uniref:uncharacterized protein LOC119381901 n=1 Tax=Rhipicephalus sanguineus TaxID=34632 RepID=UPI0020C2448D|nr:uncharacterized protein LOC119381901 [Rhipicephalus sanguineus]
MSLDGWDVGSSTRGPNFARGGNAPSSHPESFHGDVFEDVDDWLDHFDRVAAANEWNETKKLRYVYFALEDYARTWYENHEPSITNWQEFHRQLRETFRNPERKEKAEQALQSRVQKPNESVAMFVEDMSRLFRRADPGIDETKKVRLLMRCVKEQLFAGLMRKPPITVDEFIAEATTIERALQQRSLQYDRQANVATLSPFTCGQDLAALRELVRSVVREELEKVRPTPTQPTVTVLGDIIRDEIRNVPKPSPTSGKLRTATSGGLKDPSGRLARWSLRLQEFDVTVVYKSGRKHTDADCLSRAPVESTPPDQTDDESFLMAVTASDLAQKQRDDLELRPLIVYLEGQLTQPPRTFRRTISSFFLRDNILYKRNFDPSARTALLVVPSAMREEILNACHDEPSSGHLGFTRTLARIRHKYYWPKLSRTVKHYVKTCRDCQRRKIPPVKPAGFLHPVEPPRAPFQQVGMDLLGPFPKSSAGHRTTFATGKSPTTPETKCGYGVLCVNAAGQRNSYAVISALIGFFNASTMSTTKLSQRLVHDLPAVQHNRTPSTWPG